MSQRRVRHRCQQRFDPSVMHGPGRPSRCAGRLSLVWRPRLDPGSQLGGANCASPGRQRTHMRVRNSQSGTANGPCRDLQNTQHDAIATPTGNSRSRHRRLPLYRHKREAVTSLPIPSSHTLAATASRERGQAEAWLDDGITSAKTPSWLVWAYARRSMLARPPTRRYGRWP